MRYRYNGASKDVLPTLERWLPKLGSITRIVGKRFWATRWYSCYLAINKCGRRKVIAYAFSLNKLRKELRAKGKEVDDTSIKIEVERRSYSTTHEVVMVHGTEGTARFSGVCWQYTGEGPRTLRALLVRCGVPEDVAKRVAFSSPRKSTVGTDWSIENVDMFKRMTG